MNIVTRTLEMIGSRGLWVMDSAYDSGVILYYFLRRGLNFVVRPDTSVNRRHVIVDDKSVDVKVASRTYLPVFESYSDFVGKRG